MLTSLEIRDEAIGEVLHKEDAFKWAASLSSIAKSKSGYSFMAFWIEAAAAARPNSWADVPPLAGEVQASLEKFDMAAEAALHVASERSRLAFLLAVQSMADSSELNAAAFSLVNRSDGDVKRPYVFAKPSRFKFRTKRLVFYTSKSNGASWKISSGKHKFGQIT